MSSSSLRGMFPSGFGSSKKTNKRNQSSAKQQKNNSNVNRSNSSHGSSSHGSGINMFTNFSKSTKNVQHPKYEEKEAEQLSNDEDTSSPPGIDNDVHSFIVGPQLPTDSRNMAFQTSKYIIGNRDVNDSDDNDNNNSTSIARVIHYDDISEDEQVEEEDEKRIASSSSNQNLIMPPVSQCSTLKGHTGAVSALAIDPSGARMISGSFDYSIKFWDFAGMNQSLQFFRQREEVCGSYPINDIAFSPNGELFAVAPDSSQVRLFDRDGFEQKTFKKGDQYLNDKSYTKGHTAAVTGLKWSPVDKRIVLTCSSDCTLRLWDIETCQDKQINILKTRTERGTNVAVTACAYNLSASLLGAACIDGSIQIWQTGSGGGSHFTQRPNILIRNAHLAQNDISSISFARDGNMLASRGCDGTAKLWDIRNFRDPIHCTYDLPNLYSQTDIIFSPDDRYYVTGTSIENKDELHSRLLFIDTQTNEIAKDVQVANGSIIRLIWHPMLNQIVATSSNSEIYVYYDNNMSRKGILLSLAKTARKRNIDEVSMVDPVIVTPFSLPMFKPAPSKNKQKQKARKDPVKSHKPSSAPTLNKGKGGMVVENVTHMMMKNVGLVSDDDLRQDPREALLKYAEEADGQSSFTNYAYQQTQPVPIYDYSEYEQQGKEKDGEDIEKNPEFRFKKRKLEE